MNLESLIGKTFLENEFFELLQFDIEENFGEYFGKYVHFYFERQSDLKIRVSELVYFKNSHEMNQCSRKIIEKKEWFEITHDHNHFILLLCRLDRNGSISMIERDSTLTHEWKHGWADEEPDLGPMTREEIRQGFLELGGFFEDQQELQKLRSKKSV